MAIAQARAAAAAPNLGSAAAPLDIDYLPIKQEVKKKIPKLKRPHRIHDAEGKPIVADYHIDGKYCTLSAMGVFTRGLDGLNPTVETVAQESDCLRAYLIADRLQCLPLQEAIIEALRFYYAKNDVQFARITWLNTYKRDDTSDRMMLFLIAQVARVYAEVGERQFMSKNSGYNTFMLEGPRHVCKEITDAIGKHAEATERRMPGSGRQSYRGRKRRKGDEEVPEVVPTVETIDD